MVTTPKVLAGSATLATLTLSASLCWAQPAGQWNGQVGTSGGTWNASSSGAGIPKVAMSNTFSDFNDIVLTGSLGTLFSYTARDTGNAAVRAGIGTDIGSLALDWFFYKQLSIGGQFGYNKNISTDSPEEMFFTPRVGFNAVFTNDVNMWIRFGVSYRTKSTETSKETTVGGATSVTNTTTDYKAVSLVLDAPIIYHVSSHFFLGLGPRLSLDVMNKVETTVSPAPVTPPPTSENKEYSFGVSSLVGGHF